MMFIHSKQNFNGKFPEIRKTAKIEGKIVFRVLNGKDLNKEEDDVICEPYIEVILPNGRRIEGIEKGL